MNIAILGHGKEGQSVEKYFANPDNTIKIYDNFSDDELKNISTSQYDMVFRSPSVKPLDPNWTSITKYFFDNCICPIIGVTGTKGKGTTCSLITHILKSLGKTVHLVGNIGVPALDVLDQIQPDDIVVYEMSSFQLWDLNVSPHIAVVLRIEPDHLNIHKDFAEYVAAKSNIANFQTPDDSCIYYRDNPVSTKVALSSAGAKIPYPITSDRSQLESILDSLTIPGQHNRENAEAALLAVATFLGLSLEALIDAYQSKLSSALSSFTGLPHRCQFIREYNGVLYYDDNYSAASPAMEVAIKAFADHPTILIAGGKDRNLDLTPHKTAIFGSANIKKAILIGETKELLAKGEDPNRFEFADTLEDAVRRAREIAEMTANEIDSCLADFSQRKPVVLMSPGAASFDMFKNFEERGNQYQSLVYNLGAEQGFRFDDYSFDPTNFTATFNYTGIDGTSFSEQIQFAPSTYLYDQALLNKALFLSFILIGTSYYKSHPTPTVHLDTPIDDFQAKFFSKVYQEGLSQFAFENNLSREDLAHFTATAATSSSPIAYSGSGVLSLQSGGKDSLLTATTLRPSKNTAFWYLSSSSSYPNLLDTLPAPLNVATRSIDYTNLKLSQSHAGKNGHVPVTYIVQSLALAQAIINGQNIVLTSIGREGNEPHAYIDDLPVNHQWSKTWEAEQLFADYVSRYISPNIKIGSPLRCYSELMIAKLFVKYCWKKYGTSFSSCNVANYRQKTDNQTLHWCGDCAKCANSYLLFAPFVSRSEISSIFPEDLFTKPSLRDTFKGLLGIDGFMKPFECIGEIDELRMAYSMKQKDYGNLPFEVPEPSPDFDYSLLSDSQKSLQELLDISQE